FTGTIHPEGLHATLVGRHDAATTMQLALPLTLRNQNELRAFLANVSDPRSSGYGHYLTTAQFAERFGPTRDQVNAVTAYLTGRGFTVHTNGPAVLDAAGSTAAVESAF